MQWILFSMVANIVSHFAMHFFNGQNNKHILIKTQKNCFRLFWIKCTEKSDLCFLIWCMQIKKAQGYTEINRQMLTKRNQLNTKCCMYMCYIKWNKISQKRNTCQNFYLHLCEFSTQNTIFVRLLILFDFEFSKIKKVFLAIGINNYKNSKAYKKKLWSKTVWFLNLCHWVNVESFPLIYLLTQRSHLFFFCCPIH